MGVRSGDLKIRVVLMSVLPAYDYWWQPGMKPAEKIVALNAWMKEYAAKRRVVYVDVTRPCPTRSMP